MNDERNHWDSIELFEVAKLTPEGRKTFAPRTTRPEFLEHLAKDKDASVRRLVAGNHAAPIGILELLCGDEDVLVRRGVAANLMTPVSVFTELARDPDKFVRQDVGRNRCCPTPLIESFAAEDLEAVRWGVAANPRAPARILEPLAQDESLEVRGKVAENPNCPAALLHALAVQEVKHSPATAHKAAIIRRNVSKNVATSPSTLELLASDAAGRLGAAGNPKTPQEVLATLAGAGNEAVRTVVASNPSAGNDLLQILAGDQSVEVRVRLGLNPHLPATLLRELSQDSSPYVRESVGRNLSCPESILFALAHDTDLFVRAGVAANPRLSIALIEDLIGDVFEVRLNLARNTNVPGNWLHVLSEKSESKIQREIASNPAALSQTLFELAGSVDLYIRKAVLFNPVTEIELVIELSKRDGF